MDISAFYLCWLFLWRSLPPAAQLLELPALKHMTGTKQWLPSGGKKYCCGWRCTHNRPFENLKKNKMLFWPSICRFSTTKAYHCELKPFSLFTIRSTCPASSHNCPLLPAASVIPLAAEWLVPFRSSKDCLNEAMAPVSAPATSTHPSEPTAAM